MEILLLILGGAFLILGGAFLATLGSDGESTSGKSTGGGGGWKYPKARVGRITSLGRGRKKKPSYRKVAHRGGGFW